MKHRPAGGIPADHIGPLYDRFAGALYRYALMILADPAGAADAVHHVFLSLLTGSGTQMDDEERYLRRAVRNACYSALRQRRPEIAADGEAQLLEAADANGDRPIERLAIEQAMRALPA